MRNHDRHRSRSPQAGSTRHRSRSPGRRHDGKREKAESNSQAHSHSQSHSHSHSRRKHDHIPRGGTAPLKLPLNARQLVKQDLSQFRAMFGLYLDLQKNKDIYAMTEDEVKGRWKSFIGKWNRGELAEGWYDPATKNKADRGSIATERTAHDDGLETSDSQSHQEHQQDVAQYQDQVEPRNGNNDNDDEDDDEYGPSLPSAVQRSARGPGPAIPSLQDLQHRDELSLEDEEARRSDLRYERKLDRLTQKERLDDIAPRADPGSRERKIEKKQEAAASNRAFREARSPGAEEVGEKDLLGDDGDGIKRKIREMDKKKTERELRKEEVLRAREAEREERLRVHREKEDKTMENLRAIARERFGANC